VVDGLRHLLLLPGRFQDGYLLRVAVLRLLLLAESLVNVVCNLGVVVVGESSLRVVAEVERFAGAFEVAGGKLAQLEVRGCVVVLEEVLY